MPSIPERAYIDLAKAYILSILQSEHAATPAELEARCSERDGTRRTLVDVNHVVTAREELLDQNLIVYLPAAPTRGGHEVPIYHLPIVRGNQRSIIDAAARKRLLTARWLGWAMGTRRYKQGLIGPAGDSVLSASVMHDQLRGIYLPLEPDAGEVRSLFGKPVPGGSLDSGAYVVGRIGSSASRPVLTLMEMKNLRTWLFPRSLEVYQVLDKAARLTLENPGTLIAPMLICRRRHHTLFNMGSDLGLFVVELHRQFMLPSAEAPPDKVEEVRVGLGFRFLTQTVDPDPILVKVLRGTIPPKVEGFAERFSAQANIMAPFFRSLRDESLDGTDRDELLLAFREEVLRIPDARGGW